MSDIHPAPLQRSRKGKERVEGNRSNVRIVLTSAPQERWLGGREVLRRARFKTTKKGLSARAELDRRTSKDSVLQTRVADSLQTG